MGEVGRRRGPPRRSGQQRRHPGRRSLRGTPAVSRAPSAGSQPPRHLGRDPGRPTPYARPRRSHCLRHQLGGLGGLPTWSAYAASKWGVEGWAESLAFEVGPPGIDVALVEPGAFPTGVWTKAARYGSPDGPYGPTVVDMEAADHSAAPSGGDPVAVARAVARAFDARHPPFRRPVGRGAWLRWVARGVVPFGVQRRLLARVVG